LNASGRSRLAAKRDVAPLTSPAQAWDCRAALVHRRNGLQRFALILLGISLCAQAASAAEPASRCVVIDDDDARLACYDEAFGRVAPVGATTHAAATASAAPTTAALPERPAKDFGLSAEQRAPSKEPSELVATVASVQAHSHVGRWIITLDNGQVWEQRETTSEARRPRPGDTVTISKASLGSYLLTAPGRGSSRVRRIR